MKLCCRGFFFYNSSMPCVRNVISAVILLNVLVLPGAVAQRAPAATAARILLLPRQVVAGDRATLAVLDVNGRLTPGVEVHFSNGEKYKTDATGRARFVAPLNPGVIFGSLPRRAGKIAVTILPAAETSAPSVQIVRAPKVASISDRFEISGAGFCGDADANHVTIAGNDAIVVASSPVSLVLLAPLEQEPGPASVKVTCGQQSSPEFAITLVSLELKADSSPLSPGEHRELTVQIRGTAAPVTLEARNLAPNVATLTGGVSAHAISSGGRENQARFEVTGKERGSFLISIHLVPTPAAVHPFVRAIP